MNFKVGTILKRSKAPFVHIGMYLGNGQVLHNHPDSGESVVSIGEFAKNCVVATSGIVTITSEIRQRIQDTIRSPKKYNATSNNCEHTISRIVNGSGESPQLKIWGTIAIGTLLACIFKSR